MPNFTDEQSRKRLNGRSGLVHERPSLSFRSSVRRNQEIKK